MKKLAKLITCALSVVALTCGIAVYANAEDASDNFMPLRVTVDSSKKFKDVSKESWYKKYVDKAASLELMTGREEDAFCPENNTTRAEFVTVLWRINDSPSSDVEFPFTDLHGGWFTEAVRWTFENNIVEGISPTEFAPDNNITREQIAVILYRYLKNIKADDMVRADISSFPDEKDVSDWAHEAICWAYADGIIEGSEEGDGSLLLIPRENATRAQISALITRFCEKHQDIFSSDDDPAEDDEYKNISCFPINGITKKNFGIPGSNYCLTLQYGTDWDIAKKSDSSYEIRRDDSLIGMIIKGESQDLDKWKTIGSRSAKRGETNIYEYIEKFGSGITLRFRYRYVYEREENGEKRLITVLLSYSDVNSMSTSCLYINSQMNEICSNPKFGYLSDREYKNIIILGNSFIGTSSVGYILDEMLANNNKTCNVTSISRGYASVSTYVNDSEIMRDIGDGIYDAVFICGLYDSDEVRKIGVLQKKCEESGTKLVVFPAHNESRFTIIDALEQNAPIEILDWKAEIDAFISAKKPKDLFCINDSHKHSTKLAGYVGAHMIYRSIYNEVPEAGVKDLISQSYVNKMLGDYVKTGVIRIIDEESINYLG